VKSQKAFAEAEKLAYPLLSDADGSAADRYGVLMKGRFARRVTFLVDPDGILRHVDTAVNVETHGADVAERIRSLE
jgi:peroxiredoxin Q/BCP